MKSQGGCAIIPTAVLDRIAGDATFSESTRNACSVTSNHAPAWHGYRTTLSLAVRHARVRVASAEQPLAPGVFLFNSKGTTSLPGVLIEPEDLHGNKRLTAIIATLQSLMQFYKTIFYRNSIDNLGMGLIVSIGYATDYCNAYWNGTQLIIGDGDGRAFGDFAQCEDVLAHEVAHAVTQYTMGLSYVAEAGALNESLSDIFATVFCQWRHHQPAEQADWKLGAGVIGTELRNRGYVALRSLKAPDTAGVLLPQPKHMRDYNTNGDPHVNCGIPNHAFYKAATVLGGNSWDRVILIWYSALASGRRSPNMTFAEFARLTVHRATLLFRSNAAVPRAVEQAWKDVGVL